MSQVINHIVLTLLEATVTLYPADVTGAPVLNAPIWTGAPAEKLTVKERWRIKETTPTGARYGRKHPLIPDYEISLGRVWLLQQANLNGWHAGWQNYVLDVVWREEQTGDWHRRTFYGVTISERGLDDRNIDGGFTDDQVFAAQYFTPSSGAGSPPDVTSSLPYTVTYTGTNGVPVLLYLYDVTTHQFAAQTTTEGRATVGYAGVYFNAIFADDSAPALQAMRSAPRAYRTGQAYRNNVVYRGGASGVLARSLQTGPPPVGDLPRLDFYYGAQRVATLTRTGLYDVVFTQTTPTLADGRFGFYADGVLVGTLASGEVQAQEFLIAQGAPAALPILGPDPNTPAPVVSPPLVYAARVFTGATDPNGVQAGRPGDIYNQIVAGEFVRQWIKQTGVDTNTGW